MLWKIFPVLYDHSFYNILNYVRCQDIEKDGNFLKSPFPTSLVEATQQFLIGRW